MLRSRPGGQPPGRRRWRTCTGRTSSAGAPASRGRAQHEDDRDNPGNPGHRPQRAAAVDGADDHHCGPEDRHQPDPDRDQAQRRDRPGPCAASRSARSHWDAAAATTTTTRIIQATTGGMSPWTIFVDDVLVFDRVFRLTVVSAPPRTMTRTPEKSRNPARVATNDGTLSSAVSDPWTAPIAPQMASDASTASPPGQFGPGCWTSLKAITPPISATAPTDRSTSAQQQDQRLGHRQHHVHGAQPEDVHEVARPQVGVLRGDDLEDDGDQHHRHDHGQHAAVAAADPEPPGPQVLAERLGEDRGRHVGRGHLGVEREVGRPRRPPSPALGLARVRGHGRFSILAMSVSPRH